VALKIRKMEMKSNLDIKGFAIQKGYIGKEDLALTCYCAMNRIEYKRVITPQEIPEGFIPCGSVEWCMKILGQEIVPDYYPNFLKEYLGRKVWETDKWPLGNKVFIKPSKTYKKFTGFITNGGYRGKKKGPYWCSEIVHFENEWRYYVSQGKVLTGEWYSGDEINCPDAPSIEHVEFPEGFCGAVDFGMVGNRLELVEVNHPFACGWYGNKHELYAEWLSNGWQYMLDIV
jgi:hypothetical protein